MQKLDPYINVDPGTMNPFQHGEVFVTDDGAETDLDIGHYERFLDVDLDASANVTTGQVYSTVIATRAARRVPRRDRPGRSRTSPTRSSPGSAAWPTPDIDVVITEVGGTVGDIESLPLPRGDPAGSARDRPQPQLCPCTSRSCPTSRPAAS